MKTTALFPNTIALTLFASTIGVFGSLPLPASAQSGNWVNQHCEKVPGEKVPAPTPQNISAFEIDHQFTFATERKVHWMYAARSNDGAYLFCTSSPSYQGTHRLIHPKLNFPFVDRITQLKPNSPIFTIRIREGNGRNPKISPVRLDLSNPKKPIVTPRQ